MGNHCVGHEGGVGNQGQPRVYTQFFLIWCPGHNLGDGRVWVVIENKITVRKRLAHGPPIKIFIGVQIHNVC